MMRSSEAGNPYQFSLPIKDPVNFYGRKRELHQIFDCIRKHESVNICAIRRNGKTSLLQHILHDEVRQRYLADDENTIYLYLDAQTTPPRPEGFFGEVMTSLKAVCPNLSGDIDAASPTESHMRSILRKLQPRHVVLLIDEFEDIAKCAEFPPRFFMFLRGLCIGENLICILATCKRLYDCCPYEVATSPFPNIFKAVGVGPFTPNEAQEFIAETSLRSGVPIAKVSAEVTRVAGRRPYLVQMACWHYFEAWRERGTFDDQAHTTVRQRLAYEARGHLENLWNHHLGPEERRALLLLADNRGQASIRPSVLWQLEKQGHVHEGEIAAEVLADFVRACRPSGVSQDGPEPKQSGLYTKGVRVDEESGQVYINGELLKPPLPARQFRLLSLLYENKDKICDYYKIVTEVWGEDYIDEVEHQQVAALASRLRKRIEPEGKPWKYVDTVHGRGLILKEKANRDTKD